MMTPGPSAHIWIAAGHTTIWIAFGKTGMRRDDLTKILWFDGDGLCNRTTENPQKCS